MSKSYKQNILPYVATRTELEKELGVYAKDSWQQGSVLAYYDTNDKIGLFSKSDFIIKYDEHDRPILVTERVYRKNYKLLDWLRIRRQIQNQLAHANRIDMGFFISVTFAKYDNYIDYTHFKQEWFKC